MTRKSPPWQRHASVTSALPSFCSRDRSGQHDLQSVGKAGPPFWPAADRACALSRLIPALPRVLGLVGVELCQPIADALTFFISLPFCWPFCGSWSRWTRQKRPMPRHSCSNYAFFQPHFFCKFCNEKMRLFLWYSGVNGKIFLLFYQKVVFMKRVVLRIGCGAVCAALALTLGCGCCPCRPPPACRALQALPFLCRTTARQSPCNDPAAAERWPSAGAVRRPFWGNTTILCGSTRCIISLPAAKTSREDSTTGTADYWLRSWSDPTGRGRAPHRPVR